MRAQAVRFAPPAARGGVTSTHTRNIARIGENNMSAPSIDTFISRSFAEGEPTLERPQGDTPPGASHNFWESAGGFVSDVSPLINAFTGRNTAASQPARATQAPGQSFLKGVPPTFLWVGGIVLLVAVAFFFLKRK